MSPSLHPAQPYLCPTSFSNIPLDLSTKSPLTVSSHGLLIDGEEAGNCLSRLCGEDTREMKEEEENQKIVLGNTEGTIAFPEGDEKVDHATVDTELLIAKVLDARTFGRYGAVFSYCLMGILTLCFSCSY